MNKPYELDDFLTEQQADELSYYDLYDVYEVDCDDGTEGDKVLIPKNK